MSGGSEGAVLHWDLGGPEPEALQPVTQPRATLSQAHDSNIWSMAFHPMGHLLVTASNDHTTRFWSRERPGDATSVFSGGGEKPPEIIDMSGQDDEDDAMVPGFSYGGTTKWWGKEEDPVGLGDSSRVQRAFSSEDAMDTEDFIPGLGSADQFGGSAGSSAVAPKQSGPLPGQEEMWTADSRAEDWGNRRGGWTGRGRGFNPSGPRRGRY